MARELFEYHPTIGYRFIPGLVARVRHEGGGYLIKVNDLGFRNSENVTARRAGRPRVLVFGDSYTAGDGVSNRDRYTDVLAARMPDVEVVNFGLPGSGTDQQYLAFQEYANDIECDLIVLAPMVENIVRNIDTHRVTMSSAAGTLVKRAKPWFEVTTDGLVLRHNPVPKSVQEVEEQNNAQEDSTSFLRRMNAAIDKRVPGFRPMTQRLRKISWPPQYDHADDPAWKLMSAILKQWISECRAPVMLFPVPTFGHIEGGIDPRPYQERFTELGSTTGAAVIDPLNTFLDLPLADRRACRFDHDEHPNKAGHKVLADALAPALMSALSRRQSA